MGRDIDTRIAALLPSSEPESEQDSLFEVVSQHSPAFSPDEGPVEAAAEVPEPQSFEDKIREIFREARFGEAETLEEKKVACDTFFGRLADLGRDEGRLVEVVASKQKILVLLNPSGMMMMLSLVSPRVNRQHSPVMPTFRKSMGPTLVPQVIRKVLHENPGSTFLVPIASSLVAEVPETDHYVTMIARKEGNEHRLTQFDPATDPRQMVVTENIVHGKFGVYGNYVDFVHGESSQGSELDTNFEFLVEHFLVGSMPAHTPTGRSVTNSDVMYNKTSRSMEPLAAQ